MIQIKVDEDLPNLVIQLLRDKGYAATGAVEQGMGGWKDPELWQAVQAEGRFLITADKGFADTRLYPPGAHAGVLLLRPDEDGIRPMLTLLQSVLSSFSLDALAGTVTVVTPRGIRIRRV
jgi:predicted nuclease of predicted toxin-antitoxin system